MRLTSVKKVSSLELQMRDIRNVHMQIENGASETGTDRTDSRCTGGERNCASERHRVEISTLVSSQERGICIQFNERVPRTVACRGRR